MVVEKSTKRETATSKPMPMSRPSTPLTKGVPKKVCQAGFCGTGNGSATWLSFSGAGTRSGVMRTSLTRFRRDCIDTVGYRVCCIQSPKLVLNLLSLLQEFCTRDLSHDLFLFDERDQLNKACSPRRLHHTGYPGSSHVRRFPRVAFAQVGPATDRTCGDDLVAEGFTLSQHLTERLDAPDQEAALLQGIEQTRTHGDRLLSTKRLSIGRRHHHKQDHDRIWKLA